MTENQTVTEWKPEDAMAKVRERIQASFVELIPKEHWDKMVNKVVHDFLNPSRDSWGNPVEAGLVKIIREELDKEARKRIVEILQQPEWQGAWNSNGPNIASPNVQAIIKEKAPEIMAAMFGNMLQQVVDQIRNGY